MVPARPRHRPAPADRLDVPVAPRRRRCHDPAANPTHLPLTVRFVASLAFALVAAVVATVPAAAAVTLVPEAGGAAPVAAPGAEVRPAPDPRRTTLRMAATPAVRRIDLGMPRATEIDVMTLRNRAVTAAGATHREPGQPLAIGYPRAVAGNVQLRDLDWVVADHGQRVARIEITSPGARAVRLAVTLRQPVDGLRLRVAPAGAASAFGAYTVADLGRAADASGAFWTPVLEGETAVVEIEAPAGADIAATSLHVSRIAHLVIDPGALLAPGAAMARATGIGTAATCNVDAACTLPADPALADLARSVARLSFIGTDGIPYACSGTLLGDTTGTNTPYLFTANHCIHEQSVANTLSTFWFFSAIACNSTQTPPYVQLAGGGTLLGRSQDNDWSIMRLAATPPAGTRLAPWRAEQLAAGTAVTSLHHPQGDLLKVNRGSVTGMRFIEDEDVNGDFTEVVWSSGITESGSSGALLATRNGDAYEVRGGLFGGLSFCRSPAAPDYYSRLETALPLMRSYLTPGAANPGGVVVAVEFHHAGLDHYFISTNPVEIDNLDSGRTVGWVRTGLRFLAYPTQVAGTSPVCRFYRAPAYGDSHFYSASPAECAATAAAHPVDWIYESAAVFYVALPDTTSGTCPAGTTPVYRYFNASTTNHRYTADGLTSQQMRASPRWTPEGYGPGPYYPAMCAVLQ